MAKEFGQLSWNEQIEDDCRHIIRLAVREDLDRGHDLTTLAIVPESSRASVAIVSRMPGVIAGLPVAKLVLQEMEIQAEWKTISEDGQQVNKGSILAELTSSVRDLLTAERIMLNFLGRLSGIATLTRAYVDAIAGTRARIYDTRKTTPGWRRLEKYAVRCGGGNNHRAGLYDAILIKDNHLALAEKLSGDSKHSPAQAVQAARQFINEMFDDPSQSQNMIIEVEVDTLEQLDEVLPVGPDIVLLDNMSPVQLKDAVQRRDKQNPNVELEASGGIQLATIRAVAETGVERISVGALTHSATCLDIGLDWIG